MKTARRSKITRIFLGINAVATSLVAFMTVLSGWGGVIDPRWSVLPAAIAMTFPAWWTLNLLAGVVNLFIAPRRLSIISGIAILATLSPLLTFSPVNFTSTPDNSDDDFTVMSFNTYYLEGYDTHIPDNTPNPSLDYILMTAPDIACLQETFVIPAGTRHATQGQIDSLNARYPFIVPLPKANQVILSKYPAELLSTHTFRDTSASMVHLKLDINGHPLHLFSVHLQSLRLTPGDKETYRTLTSTRLQRHDVSEARHKLIPKLFNAFRERAGQADTLAAMIRRIPPNENIILAGDFNDIPGCYAVRQLLKAGLHDAYADAACGPAITYHASRFYFRIDHIMYRGDIKPLKTWRGTCGYSDHYPLITRFVWNNTKQI